MSSSSNVFTLADFRSSGYGDPDDDAWRDMALARAFVETSRLPSKAVLAVNERLVMSTSAAAARLGAVNQAWLWRRMRACRKPGPAMLPLDGREPVRADIVPVYVGSVHIGVLVTLDLAHSRSSRSPDEVDDSFFTSAIPGMSSRACKLRAQAARAVESGANVLITGELGTGRATVARRMGEHIAAAGEPVREFDGRDADEVGWSARVSHAASHGAVVLTHLDAMRSSLVRQILAATDVSDRGLLIATACPAILTGPDGGAFVFKIGLPALRDRFEDLPAIATEVLTRASGTTKPKRLAAGIRRQLWGYSWPGNITELEQVLKGAAARAPTAFIDESCLYLPGSTSGGLGAQRRSLVDAAELDTLRDALNRCGGNKLAAADMLGISRSTLYRKVRALGL